MIDYRSICNRDSVDGSFGESGEGGEGCGTSDGVEEIREGGEGAEEGRYRGDQRCEGRRRGSEKDVGENEAIDEGGRDGAVVRRLEEYACEHSISVELGGRA